VKKGTDWRKSYIEHSYLKINLSHLIARYTFFK
jgi:hypothetical protein